MTFYRYELFTHFTSVQGLEDVSVKLREYSVIKETNKGYWITDTSWQIFSDNELGILHKKWVSKTSKRRYAYPTKKEAYINFIKRTEKRIKILENQLYICKLGLKNANETLSISNTLENL